MIAIYPAELQTETSSTEVERELITACEIDGIDCSWSRLHRDQKLSRGHE